MVAGSVYVQWASSSAGEVSQIVAFDKDHFQGDHTHIFTDIPKLRKWRNSISSMVSRSDTWQFYDTEEMQGIAKKELGPGAYPSVTDLGIQGSQHFFHPPREPQGQAFQTIRAQVVFSPHASTLGAAASELAQQQPHQAM